VLELAQYREVAAFAQFGSDLDAATQQQLLRGGILTTLLKQPQFVPMKTEEIITTLFAGVNGYLDKIAEKEIPVFEKGWLEFVRASKSELLEEIRVKKAFSDELTEKMHTAVAEFMSTQEFEKRL